MGRGSIAFDREGRASATTLATKGERGPATPSSVTSPASQVAADKDEVVAPTNGPPTLTRAGPGTLLAAAPALGGKPSASAAERLSALRSKLERSWRSAEDGFNSDLQ